ncbi:MAG: hypothetical protein R3E18_00605 [Sphingomonadaceae bacterium]
MPVNFAASRTPGSSPLARAMTRGVVACPANDNDGGGQDDRLLHAALRHFAEHGLGAAQEARLQAKQAFFTGDRERYDWWLGVCRTLDRRMANRLERETNSQAQR